MASLCPFCPSAVLSLRFGFGVLLQASPGQGRQMPAASAHIFLLPWDARRKSASSPDSRGWLPNLWASFLEPKVLKYKVFVFISSVFFFNLSWHFLEVSNLLSRKKN